MIGSELPSEMAGVVDVIDPDNYGTGTQTGAWIHAKDFIAFMAMFMAGDLGASATLDGKVEQAQDDSGTGVKDVASISQLTKAGTDQSNKQALLNLRPEDLDVANGFTHIRLSMTIGTASSDAGAVLMGFGPRHAPASDQDADSVDEIVTA